MSNKSFIFLSLASLLLGLAWLASGWASAGLAQARNAMQQVERAERDLSLLSAQLERWEAAGSDSLGSVEPVVLDAKFLPSELPNSSFLLAGLYVDNGYFNLRRFAFSWGHAAGEGSGSAANMTVEGEKVFLGQRIPKTATPGSATSTPPLPANAAATGVQP